MRDAKKKHLLKDADCACLMKTHGINSIDIFPQVRDYIPSDLHRYQDVAQ